MYYLSKIHIHNFLIYQDSEISLKPCGKYAIVGINNDENTAGSNGAGKTLLFDSITWCLYGKTLRNFPVEVIKGKFDDNTFVATTWVSEQDTIIIKRSFKKDSRVTIKVNDNEVVLSPLQTNDYIVKLFNIDYELFKVLVISGQEQSKFCDLSSSLRIKLLSDILKLDEIELYYEKCKEFISQLNIEISKIDNELNTLATYRKVYLEDIKQLIETQKNLETEFYNFPIDKLGKMNIDRNISFENINQQYNKINNELLTVNSRLKTLQLSNNDLKNKLERLRKEDKKCPYCGSVIEDDIYSRLSKDIKNNIIKNDQLIEKYNVDKEKLEKQKEEIQEEIKKYEKLQEDRITLTQLNNKFNNLTKEYQNNLNKLHNTEIKLLENIKRAISLLHDKNTVIKELKDFEKLKELYSNKGIKNIVIDKIINNINKVVNIYIRQLFSSNFYLNMVYENNKLEIYLNDDNNSRKYEWLSGGQKSKVRACFNLAFNNLVPHRFGLIILDEIEGLDNVSFHTVFNLLKDCSFNKTMMVISHNDLIRNYFENMIFVEKTNGISRLRVW